MNLTFPHKCLKEHYFTLPTLFLFCFRNQYWIHQWPGEELCPSLHWRPLQCSLCQWRTSSGDICASLAVHSEQGTVPWWMWMPFPYLCHLQRRKAHMVSALIQALEDWDRIIPVYSGKQTAKSTLWILSSKRSFLFKKRIIDVSMNHLLLHISLKSLRDSCILLVLSSSYSFRSYSLRATQKTTAVTSWKQCIHFFLSLLWPPTSTILRKKLWICKDTHILLSSPKASHSHTIPSESSHSVHILPLKKE